ncbi:hypothetical protein [Flavonifractor phage Cormatin]|nr:hypothetical protein [Flavonifractor phage Cormatin]
MGVSVLNKSSIEQPNTLANSGSRSVRRIVRQSPTCIRPPLSH